MRIFVAGIMQGSRQDDDIGDQDYRTAIRDIILRKYPEAEVVCPMELYPDSPGYGYERGKRTFLDLVDRASEADVMGTAIEMWQACGGGARVLSITPMANNWVVKFLSDRVFPTMEDFADFIASDGLSQMPLSN